MDDWLMKGLDPDLRCDRLASVQGGLMTRQQLRRLGLTDHQIRTKIAGGRLLEIDAGDLLQHAAYALNLRDSDRSSWLLLHPSRLPYERLDADGTPKEILSGSLGLSLRLVSTPTTWTTFLVPLGAAENDDVTFVTHDVRRGEWEWLDGVPVTSPTVAVADMILGDDEEDDVRTALVDVIASGSFHAPRFIELVTPATPRWGLEPGNGRLLLRELLAQPRRRFFAHQGMQVVELHDEEIVCTTSFPTSARASTMDDKTRQE